MEKSDVEGIKEDRILLLKKNHEVSIHEANFLLLQEIRDLLKKIVTDKGIAMDPETPKRESWIKRLLK